MAFFCLATAGCSNVTDQQTSESQHDQQVAILKQIRKVNDDGSYSFGYEAGDGSFKVSRKKVLLLVSKSANCQFTRSLPKINIVITNHRQPVFILFVKKVHQYFKFHNLSHNI